MTVVKRKGEDEERSEDAMPKGGGQALESLVRSL